MQGRKQKSGWVSDTKVTATTFDELFDEEHIRPESQQQTKSVKHEENMGKSDITRAWARHVSLEVGGSLMLLLSSPCAHS